jgi:hypothetical protein
MLRATEYAKYSYSSCQTQLGELLKPVTSITISVVRKKIGTSLTVNDYVTIRLSPEFGQDGVWASYLVLLDEIR